MIYPISTSPVIFRKNLLSKNNKYKVLPQNNTNYLSKNINFCGYLYSPVDNFKTTVNKNYFQLPKVRLKNGELYQLPPDENQIMAAKELYDGNSLLYCVSTGSGKTAVAHWAITNNLSKGKKTIFTVPTKALANDKYDEFCEIYGKEKTGILTGDKKHNATAPVVIMTTEIYDKQIESGVLNSKNTGTIIYDEAHYIADDERGTAWENSIIESAKKNIQILLLSATIGNSEEFKNWIASLNSERPIKKIEVDSKERFVPQLYYSYFHGNFTPLIDGKINLEARFTKRQNRALETIFKAKENKDIGYTIKEQDLKATLEKLKENIKKDGYNTREITLEELKTVLKNNYSYLNDDNIEAVTNLLLNPEDKIIKKFHHPYQENNYPKLVYDMKQENMLPAIIYRLSKRKCEDTASCIAFNELDLDLTTEKEKAQIAEIIENYQKNKSYLGIFTETEKEKLLKGIGTHHSSKAPEYKKLVEDLFRKKLLKVVVATSTLGVGIDMPAKSTVITDMTYRQVDPVTQKTYYQPISVNEFYQMTGRAGRRGQDSIGNVIIYNPFNVEKPKEKQENDRIDEEALIQSYLISRPNDLTSNFKPSVSGLEQYFMENNSQEDLRNIIKNSFKVYLAENKEAEINSLMKEFQKCENMLIKEGYLYKNADKINITPKGKILSLSKCSNPLMLSALMYDKTLKDVSVAELCQIAGYISGSKRAKETNETIEFKKMLANRVLGLQSYIERKKQKQIFKPDSGYNRAKTLFQNKENGILKNIEEARIDFDGKTFSNELSGYILYCFAILNENKKNSISNFNNVINFSLIGDKEATKNIYKLKSTPGNNYKIIAQSISILKQMNYICNYALNNDDEYPETEYWQNLKDKCEQAIKLINQEPINEHIEEELPAFIQAKKLPINICPICNEPMAEEYKAQKYARRMLFLNGYEAHDYIEKGIKEGLLYPMAQNEKRETVFNSTAQKALEKIKDLTLVYPDNDVRSIIEMLSSEYFDDIRVERMLVIEELEQFVRENIKDENLNNELNSIFKQANEEILEQTEDEFKNKKFNYKIERALKKYNVDLSLTDEITKIINKMPSSKDDIRAFFIRFNKQSNEKIASAFANKKIATATEISPALSESQKTDNYIKICTPCKEDRAGKGFSQWIKTIPDFREKMKKYIEIIKNTSQNSTIAEKYAENLDARIEKKE